MPRRGWPHGAAASRTRGRPSAGRPVSDQRGRLPVATLGFAGLPMLSYDVPSGSCVSGSTPWAGISAIATGMARQGSDLQLARYDERGWRATFYPTGMEHSITSVTASAWKPTSWRAVQCAARDALRQAE